MTETTIPAQTKSISRNTVKLISIFKINYTPENYVTQACFLEVYFKLIY